MKATFLIVVLFLVLSAAATVSAKDNLKTEYERERQEADKIYQQLHERKKEIYQLSHQEREILSALGKVENLIDRQNARLEDLTAVLEQKRADLSQTEVNLKKAEGEGDQLKEQARHRAIAYYKFGPVGFMNILFSSYSIPDLLARQEALRFMLGKDGVAISALQSKLLDLSRIRQGVLASSQALQQVKGKIQAEARYLEKLRAQRADLLAAVCQKKKECLHDIRGLQEAAQRLNATIQALQRKIEEEAQQKPETHLSRGFAAHKGKLAPPAKGKVVGLFGRIRRSSSGATIVRNGIDIQVPGGTEIHSIYTGRVIYIGNLKGYGNIIILDHGDKYYSLYAHASEFFKEVGNIVKKGEALGLIEVPGSLRAEWLYFEIRHRGKPENPLSWLDVKKLTFGQ